MIANPRKGKTKFHFLLTLVLCMASHAVGASGGQYLWGFNPGKGYVDGKSYEQVRQLCASQGGKIAKKEQLIFAHSKGFSMCAYGWLDNGVAGFVAQGTNAGCGRDGWNQGGNYPRDKKLGGYCVAPRVPAGSKAVSIRDERAYQAGMKQIWMTAKTINRPQESLAKERNLGAVLKAKLSQEIPQLIPNAAVFQTHKEHAFQLMNIHRELYSFFRKYGGESSQAYVAALGGTIGLAEAIPRVDGAASTNIVDQKLRLDQVQLLLNSYVKHTHLTRPGLALPLTEFENWLSTRESAQVFLVYLDEISKELRSQISPAAIQIDLEITLGRLLSDAKNLCELTKRQHQGWWAENEGTAAHLSSYAQTFIDTPHPAGQAYDYHGDIEIKKIRDLFIGQSRWFKDQTQQRANGSCDSGRAEQISAAIQILKDLRAAHKNVVNEQLRQLNLLVKETTKFIDEFH